MIVNIIVNINKISKNILVFKNLGLSEEQI